MSHISCNQNSLQLSSRLFLGVEIDYIKGANISPLYHPDPATLE